jgi:hypothetical protein
MPFIERGLIFYQVLGEIGKTSLNKTFSEFVMPFREQGQVAIDTMISLTFGQIGNLHVLIIVIFQSCVACIWSTYNCWYQGLK